MSLIPVPLEVVYPKMELGSASHSHETDDVDFDDNVVLSFIAARACSQRKKNVAYNPPL